jgi:hypothetical protein
MMTASSSAPWAPCSVTRDEQLALKALATGTANDVQQKAALGCIIGKISGYYGLSVTGPEPTSVFFMEGRRYVGGTITGVINAPVLAQKAEAAK